MKRHPPGVRVRCPLPNAQCLLSAFRRLLLLSPRPRSRGFHVAFGIGGGSGGYSPEFLPRPGRDSPLEVDGGAAELCYATGGDLPMLRRSGATQEVEILYGDEMLPLGIEMDSLLINRKIQLAAGDTLLLVTDGVVEALGPDRDHFQMGKLAEILRQGGSGARQLVEDIFEEFGRITPAQPEDDLTVLAVTWTPQQMGVQK